MNLAQKLQYLRNENRLSQEELAEKLGISRQAISKWESGISTPDLNKLIKISEIYNVTLDSLVKEEEEITTSKDYDISKIEEKKSTQVILNFDRGSLTYEYKSKKTLFGIPIVHINIGRGVKKAKGIIAIGNISYGLLSIGLVSLGIINFGLISIGVISVAAFAIGLLLAIGAISVGLISIGAIAIGIFSIGSVAIGKYSIGACAIASDIAVGDYANANIAIGNKIKGANTFPLDASKNEIKSLIKKEYPYLTEWFINIIIESI